MVFLQVCFVEASTSTPLEAAVLRVQMSVYLVARSLVQIAPNFVLVRDFIGAILNH